VTGEVFVSETTKAASWAAFTERRSDAYASAGAVPVEAARGLWSPNAASARTAMRAGAEMT